MTFHSLASDPQQCQEMIQQVCAQQKTISERELAELEQLPQEEEPYDPALPDGCSVALCIVLPDKRRYVVMQSQHWYNHGRTFHSPLIPDIFDIAYYSDKVAHGEYGRSAIYAIGE
jgi:hypothetical protein